jgi:hypothetical protein
MKRLQALKARLLCAVMGHCWKTINRFTGASEGRFHYRWCVRCDRSYLEDRTPVKVS